MTKEWPLVSIVIPTLNAYTPLLKCLKSIKKQVYPKKSIEIIIADGGSTDKTISLAKAYKAKIFFNKLKTAEAGKAIGVKQAKGKYIALIDSDNILPNKNWLKIMIEPLENNSELIGSEPWLFTYRPHSGVFERYSALIGANDPYAFISGVYDRKNYINNRWTNLDIETKNHKNFLEITLKPNQQIPTIGANGTIFRSDFLKNNFNSDYLFDIDLMAQFINERKLSQKFAKVKTGIIHTFCESSFKKFIRKQNRRIIDYYTYHHMRQYDWNKTNKTGIIKFILYVLLVIPMIFDSFRGFIKKPDLVWFIHPIVCVITLYLYFLNTLKKQFRLLKELDRKQWQQ